MNEADALCFADEKLQQHKLNGWRIEVRSGPLSQKYKHLCVGLTRFFLGGGGVIFLRQRDVLGQTDAFTRETTLHEIAHALAGPSHGHDETWAIIARNIGCSDILHYLNERSIHRLYKAVKQSSAAQTNP